MAEKVINSNSFDKLDPKAWALVRVVRDLDKATGKERIRSEWEKKKKIKNDYMNFMAEFMPEYYTKEENLK